MATCTMCGRDFSSCHHGRAAQSDKEVDMSNTALDQSIRHWKRIARGEGNSQGSDNCQLCKEHYTDTSHCYTCPVAHRVCRPGCNGTPYLEYTMSASTVHGFVGFRARSTRAKALAWDMARFLQSLKNEETLPWAKPRCN